MSYYVWHDDGCCDNKTDDLESARRIEKELLDAGHNDVYITNADNEVVDETYVECSFCERRAVAFMPQSTDLGQTVSMVYCCPDHRYGWLDGAVMPEDFIPFSSLPKERMYRVWALVDAFMLGDKLPLLRYQGRDHDALFAELNSHDLQRHQLVSQYWRAFQKVPALRSFVLQP